jgi:hypothetical protein
MEVNTLPARGAMSELEWILARATLLRHAQQRVDASFRQRDDSPEAWAAWSAACTDFHTARRLMYDPELKALSGRLRSGDPAAIESGVVFVEADPWCYQSGYMKERLLRGLRYAPLTAHQIRRLRQALFHAVDRSDRRELAQWWRLAERLDHGLVVTGLEQRVMSHQDRNVRRRAGWMLRQVIESRRGPARLHLPNSI